jgi:hypothetical protein
VCVSECRCIACPALVIPLVPACLLVCVLLGAAAAAADAVQAASKRKIKQLQQEKVLLEKAVDEVSSARVTQLAACHATGAVRHRSTHTHVLALCTPPARRPLLVRPLRASWQRLARRLRRCQPSWQNHAAPWTWRALAQRRRRPRRPACTRSACA